MSFWLSGLSFLLITIPPNGRTVGKGTGRFLGEITQGFRFILNRRHFRSLIVFASAANFVASPMAIFTVVYARQVLHGSSSLYGLLEVALLSGGILGSFAAGKYSSKLRLSQWVVVALVGSGCAVAGLGLVVNRLFATGFLVVFSGVLALLNIPFITSLELLAPDDIRGRVVQSAFLLIGGVTTPIGLVVGGWMMTTFGVRTVLVAMWALLICFAGIGTQVRAFKEDAALSMGFNKRSKNV